MRGILFQRRVFIKIKRKLMSDVDVRDEDMPSAIDEGTSSSEPHLDQVDSSAHCSDESGPAIQVMF